MYHCWSESWRMKVDKFEIARLVFSYSRESQDGGRRPVRMHECLNGRAKTQLVYDPRSKLTVVRYQCDFREFLADLPVRSWSQAQSCATNLFGVRFVVLVSVFRCIRNSLIAVSPRGFFTALDTKEFREVLRASFR